MGTGKRGPFNISVALHKRLEGREMEIESGRWSERKSLFCELKGPRANRTSF